MPTPTKQVKYTDQQKAILKVWKQTKVVHPSYGEVAKKVGCSKQTVHSTVKKYQEALKNKRNV